MSDRALERLRHGLRRLEASLFAALRRLRHDDEGASLVFAAITLFGLALTTLFVFQVGMVSADRLQVQTAADAAAYSGAQVEASSLNAIGQLNDGMAYLHYTLLRYTVDAIVYGTLEQFTHHHERVNPGSLAVVSNAPNPPANNPQAPDWVMLGDEREWTDRYEHVRTIVQDRLQDGKDWLQDLHTAERLILAATPRLVTLKAAEVARLNGATHLAISEDLELAFQLEEHGGGDAAGFTDGSSVGSNTAHESSYARYSERSLEVDRRERGFPSWFEPAEGRSNGGYEQVRLCWNDDDWTHDKAFIHAEGDYAQFFMGPPAGHWHAFHMHMVQEPGSPPPPPTPRFHGGVGKGGGHAFPDDDTDDYHEKAVDAPTPHHYAVRCPTCQANTYSGMFSEVQVTESDGERGELGDAFELRFEGAFPRPLMLRAPLLRSGITVVTWREGRSLGPWFPVSEWGMIAVASAQVGYRTDRTVLPLTSVTDREGRYSTSGSGGSETVPLGTGKSSPAYRNFFYSSDRADGVRFGARLVPIARAETWHPDLRDGGGLRALLEGNRWLVCETASGPPRQATGDLRQRLTRLRDFVAVPSEQALREAFWH